ncbi:tryptophan synthase subunit beta [Pseudomonas sp. UL073]|uniref:Tryptophan synthase subunit beta n=1 Tax=Zestomonas insulae TaxID=2809017 RepID=A0ABS2IBE1_9GAMM|nr:tryptophan synthase subunit beta [Pseudomonas insulae]MBM7059118.1 tryptophan synthase subunit beta [Pseudomonas insulae]
MVYVQRDGQGRLLRVEKEPFDGMNDTLAVQSEELDAWINARLEVNSKLDLLQQSDLEMVRVLEDVVNLLVERGVISFTDLPEAARIKLDQRAVARAELEGLADSLTDTPPGLTN